MTRLVPVLAFFLSLGALAPASALPMTVLAADDPFVLAAVDCRAASARAARKTGGRVLAARPDGAASCEITLLVPNEGGRPRRVVVSVPA